MSVARPQCLRYQTRFQLEAHSWGGKQRTQRILTVCNGARRMATGLPPASSPAPQEAAGSSSSQRHEPVIRLHGYDILMDVGMRPHTHVYKVRPKLHDDVPVYMDGEEPCYALKCIDMNDPDLPAEGKQRAVRETQALLKLQHPNIARYHKAFLSDGRLCYMTEFAEQTLHHLIYTMKERQQRLSEDLTWHLFVRQHGQSAAFSCHSLLPGPPGTCSFGPGLLLTLWRRTRRSDVSGSVSVRLSVCANVAGFRCL